MVIVSSLIWILIFLGKDHVFSPPASLEAQRAQRSSFLFFAVERTAKNNYKATLNATFCFPASRRKTKTNVFLCVLSVSSEVGGKETEKILRIL